MANIALTFAPPPQTFPFQIPPGAVQPITAVPRARVRFITSLAVITAKIATNTTSIVLTFTLPLNYAYTFEYAQVSIQCPTDPLDADNFDDVGQLIYFPGNDSGAIETELISQGITGHTLNAGSVKSWTPVNASNSPLFNDQQIAIAVVMALNDNDAANTVVGAMNTFISFLQYDIDQVYNYPVNFPLPVSNR